MDKDDQLPQYNNNPENFKQSQNLVTIDDQIVQNQQSANTLNTEPDLDFEQRQQAKQHNQEELLPKQQKYRASKIMTGIQRKKLETIFDIKIDEIYSTNEDVIPEILKELERKRQSVSRPDELDSIETFILERILNKLDWFTLPPDQKKSQQQEEKQPTLQKIEPFMYKYSKK